MDTSKEYILMCEKAFDDIGFMGEVSYVYSDTLHRVVEEHIWTEKDCGYKHGSFFVLNTENYEDPHRPYLKKLDDEEVFQVYTQGELQPIVSRKNGAEWLVSDLYDFVMEERNNYDKHINQDSMEQLWLAFVMKEKFNKTWDGKDWRVGNAGD